MASLAVVLPLLLRFLSLPRLVQLLDPGVEPGGTGDRTEVERHIRLARGLLRWSSGVFRRSCLRQSLVLFRLLWRAGFPVTIRFGARMLGERLDGHSWLELDGEPIAENNDPRPTYRVTYSYPTPGLESP